MIDFDEEIRKFQPSLEVDEAEDAIYRNNTTDVTEVIDKIIREITDKKDESGTDYAINEML